MPPSFAGHQTVVAHFLALHVDVPSEQVAIELPQGGAIRAGNFKVHYRVSHCLLSSWVKKFSKPKMQCQALPSVVPGQIGGGYVLLESAATAVSMARMATSICSSSGSRVVRRCSQSPGAASILPMMASWCRPLNLMTS